MIGSTHSITRQPEATIIRHQVWLARTVAIFAVIFATNLCSGTVASAGTQPEPNTELEVPGDKRGIPYSISVDGVPVAGATRPVDKKRKTDLALESVDIQLKFDGLEVKPVLNISTAPVRRTYQAGETVKFLTSSNYPSWILRSEVRIFAANAEGTGLPLHTVPVLHNGTAKWQFPADGPAELHYVLRVYDDEGRFDETQPLSLSRSAKRFVRHESKSDAIAPGYGEDRTAFRNIPVFGGAVTVFGRNVPNGDAVRVLGETIPVDDKGAFVVQRILPPGEHNIDVKVGSKGKSITFNRELKIPASEWFYVALADLTVGHKFASGNIEDVKPGEFEDIYTKGRLAFYVKGKIKGRYLLTAAGDTNEGPVKNIFKGLDEKNPRQFLRRIDPDDYYPIYGDDSRTVEDAPSRGKVYVRLERGDSHVMWGNFKTEVSGTHFLRNERALYGANGVFKSEATTPFGARRTQATAYVAQQETVPQRDVLRATGGSAYFLKHQDITIGSDTVSVEIRDAVSDRILSRRALRSGEDYEIDYIQGLILLKQPLNSTQSDDGIVRDGALGGNHVYLTASYEFTPAAKDLEGYVSGGRAEHWIGDHLRIGASGQFEKNASKTQKSVGTDLLLRRSDATFLKAEIAQSEGPGFASNFSADGGLTNSPTDVAGISGRRPKAYRVIGEVSLEELTNGAFEGSSSAYYEKYQSGFSSIDKQATSGESSWGARGEIALSDSVQASLSYDAYKIADGQSYDELAAQVTAEIDEHWKLSSGVKIDQRRLSPSGEGDAGSRTDLAGKLGYTFNEDASVHVFGQGTIAQKGSRKRNDRLGVGGETQLTEKIKASTEISHGSSGLGALATLDYAQTADDHYYGGYRLDPDRSTGLGNSSPLSGDDLGSVVVGARNKLSDSLSTFAEDSYDLFGRRQSLTQTYGVNYTPNSFWTIGGGLEVGKINGTSTNATTGLKNSDFDRTAMSLAVGYRNEENFSGRLKSEIRLEDSEDNTRDLDSYLLGASLDIRASDDWRMLTNADVVLSDATTSVRDGKYAEASIGFAYRPTDNDAFNALLKYSLLYDYPGADQVTVSGTAFGPAQRSFLLSADASYDLNKYLTVGAKYGFRIGQTRERTAGSEWEDSSAHLGILRADLHVVKNWDALIEGRALWSPETESQDWGALAAVYRHMGDNFKVGVGYNFGRFSDDLRDIVADDHGIFVNAIGKF